MVVFYFDLKKENIYFFGCILTAGNLFVKSFMFTYTKKYGRFFKKRSKI